LLRDLPSFPTRRSSDLHGQAILYQATPLKEYGWINGHAHEIALPLAAVSPEAPNPLCGPLPTVTNTHGQLSGAAEAIWLSTKLFTHPERMTEIVTEQLPALLAELNSPHAGGCATEVREKPTTCAFASAPPRTATADRCGKSPSGLNSCGGQEWPVP